MNRSLLLTVLLLTLSGCATGPRECPSPPELTARVPLGESFQDRMQPFLQGKLPEQTDSGQP